MNKKIYRIMPDDSQSALGAGVVFNGKKFITHTLLSETKSAVITATLWQKIFFSIIGLTIIAGLIISPLKTLGIIVAGLTTVYFVDVIFNLYVIFKSLYFPPEICIKDEEINSLDPSNLPTYSILCPLYKESEVIGQFLNNINNIDWPKNKLDVILLLEEDDLITQEAASQMVLPEYVRVVIVPHSLPKTKPKACNYGLQIAKGEYLVIYDAEDMPDPLQLKKAYITFQKVPRNTYCLQAKLNYYNSSQNLLTRLFTAEYSLWFDVILPGLQSINTSIPLGGTSNHFRTKDLLKLQGWDPFNVTEDCDLGIRLFKEGYKTAIFDSTTLEEANSEIRNWIRQRSRWIKGYLQTYLVHTRDPINFLKDFKFHALIFQLIIGLRISFILINPILWLVTISYFAFYPIIGHTIELLYPPIIFYMAVFSIIFGNFIYLYNYMIGLAKKEQWSIIKFVYLVPIYWFMMTFGAVLAFYQLIFRPYFWEKTNHGLHIQKPKTISVVDNIFEKLKNYTADIKEADLILVLAAISANFLNFLYNAYLSRNVDIENFGLISLIGNFFLIISIPIYALSSTVANKSAFFLGKYNLAIKNFWSHTRKNIVSIGLLIALAWTASTPFLMHFFQSKTFIPFIVFSPVWLIGLTSAVDSGFLSGNLQFKTIALLITLEAFIKLVFSISLVNIGYANWIYLAIPLSMLFSFALTWRFAKNIEDKNIEINEDVKSFPSNFFLSSLLIKFSLIAFLSFDVILSKHYLDPVEAGKYALIALAGKMIFFISTLFSQFLLPLVSKSEGSQNDSNKIFYKLLTFSALLSLISYVGIGLLGRFTAPILFGPNILTVVHLLPLYGLAIFCFTVASNIATFNQIKSKNLFPVVNFVMALIQIVGIIIFHQSVESIVMVMTVVSGLNLISNIILYFDYPQLDLSLGQPKTDEHKRTSILIFNWYDTKHKLAGGAEIYLQKIAKYLIKKGCDVTWFCGNDGFSPKEDNIEGIKIIRKGGLFTVPIWAFFYYIFQGWGNYDLVIDTAKGVPFFTPLYVRIPKIGIVFHVHQKMFESGLSFPLKQIAMTLEAKLMPLVYKNIDIVTISKSSKKAMKKLGFKKKNISIATPGVEIKFSKVNKTLNPSVIYLGRLRRYKQVDVLIEAFSKVKKNNPEAKLIIAGSGESENYLRELTRKLKLEKSVNFKGRVTEEEKSILLSKAWIAVQPSEIEGWGITNIEANKCGTPVIASNVDGLKDSIINGKTGILFPSGDVDTLASAIEKIINHDNFRLNLSKNAINWSKKFKWYKSGKIFLNLINQKIKGPTVIYEGQVSEEWREAYD